MTTITVKTQTGSTGRDIELNDAIFGVQPNVPVMHQVVTAQLAAARSGTQSTKTRAEVRGGGKKPWRQKGTGKARQGSTRAPHWAGGGVALGPKPRDYRQKTPKKMVQLALRSALSDRANDGKIVVVDTWSFTRPQTKEAAAALDAIVVDGKVLVVVGRDDIDVAKSFRNLPDVHVILNSELNAYDVLVSDWVVFTEATLPKSTETETALADSGEMPPPTGASPDEAPRAEGGEATS